MDNYGFVYCMENFSMPGYYKIGYTTKSPHTRANELSKATGVIGEFHIVCYMDIANPFKVEQEIHKKLDRFRSQNGKEFFKTNLEEIIPYFWFNEDKNAFVDFNAAPTLKMQFNELPNPYREFV